MLTIPVIVTVLLLGGAWRSSSAVQCDPHDGNVLACSVTKIQPCDPSLIGVDLRSCPLPIVDNDGSEIELHFMPMHLTTPAASFVTRAFAGRDRVPSIPGPVIRTRQNQVVKITLYNDLDDRQTPRGTAVNGFFEFNTTNLHTHGLHVSGEQPQDDVAVRIPPGYRYRYELEIGPHESGLHFYHAHAHGATRMQIGGGAFGLFIIDDEPGNSPASFLRRLPTTIVSIWHFPASALAAIADDNDVFRQVSGGIVSSLRLVNGFLRPKLTMNANQWNRLRLHYSSTDEILRVTIPACQVVLLALDGVWLSQPRVIPVIQFLEASRVEVAVACPPGGPFPVQAADGTTVFTIAIEAIAEQGPATLDAALWQIPPRPDYLQDTTGIPDDQVATFALTINSPHTDAGINGRKFSGVQRDDALHVMRPGTVQQWALDVNEHPLHVHMVPFQLQADSSDGFYRRGDWIDTYLGPPIAVRAHITADLNGKVMLHCHIAEHADMGVGGILWVDGTSRQRQRSPERVESGVVPYRGAPRGNAHVNSFVLALAVGIVFAAFNEYMRR
ncbi:unnamed protein product (mitochondrion) [Plasmodiophora brassicae]|uniref:Plastocyanin-like domain-containing protein n=1 Tax=Plasmodiophora brassicae TaxID=37360 RepID=A0A3P3Y8V9_PLABS|nr:unnamed protein product [Plasmodiophora brassicae]